MKSIELRAALTAAALSILLVPSLAIPDSALAAGPGWVWPVTGAVITHYRNGADPYAGGQHRGIDIAAPVGTPVVAATGGQVVYAGLAGSSGLTVAVRTEDGRLETTYLHLASVAVHAGGAVAAGDRLGAVGTTGRRSAVEPHLHFGVRDAGDRFGYHDPLEFLPPPPAAPGLRVPDPVAIPVAAPARPDLIGAPSPRAATPASGPHSAVRPAPAGAARVATPGTVPSSAPAPRHRTASGQVAPAMAHRVVRTRAPMAGPRRAAAVADRPAAARGTVHQSAVATRGGPGGHGVDAGWLVACGALVLAAVVLGKPKGLADSIGSWATTSPRRSITSTPSRTSGTRTRRSPPTCSPATCASAARTFSS